MKSSSNENFCAGCNGIFSTKARKHNHKCVLHQHPSGATCVDLVQSLVKSDALGAALDQMPLPTRGKPAMVTDAAWKSPPIILALTSRRAGPCYSVKALLAAQLTIDIAARCSHGAERTSAFHAPMLVGIKAIRDPRTRQFTRVEIEAVMPDRPLSGNIWLPVTWQTAPELCFLADEVESLPIRRPFESVDQLVSCLTQLGIHVNCLMRGPTKRARLIRARNNGISLVARWQLLCSPLASKFFNSQAS